MFLKNWYPRGVGVQHNFLYIVRIFYRHNVTENIIHNYKITKITQLQITQLLIPVYENYITDIIARVPYSHFNLFVIIHSHIANKKKNCDFLCRQLSIDGNAILFIF